MTAGARDTLITFEAKGEGTDDPVYGPQPGTWGTHSQVWAEVQDILPSRAESVDDSISLARRPARVRIDYFDGIGITSDMRIDIDGRKLRIVAGPAMKGKRLEWEFLVEQLSTEGEAP